VGGANLGVDIVPGPKRGGGRGGLGGGFWGFLGGLGEFLWGIPLMRGGWVGIRWVITFYMGVRCGSSLIGTGFIFIYYKGGLWGFRYSQTPKFGWATYRECLRAPVCGGGTHYM